MRVVKEVWYWRLAVLRVFTYMTITAVATFLTQTESYGTNQWNDLGDFVKFRILISCLAAAGTVFVAFMDSTMGELRKTPVVESGKITTVTMETIAPEPVKLDTEKKD